MFTKFATVTAKELTAGNIIHSHGNYYFIKVATHYSDGTTMLDVKPAEPNVFNPLKSSLVLTTKTYDIY